MALASISLHAVAALPRSRSPKRQDRGTSGNLAPWSVRCSVCYNKKTKRSGHPEGATGDARSKRAPGRDWQASGRRILRADVRELKRGADDPSLSGVGGLVDFNAFTQREGLGRQRAQDFGHLRTGKHVVDPVYPMHTQIQLLIDAAMVGARRVFDFEWLASDPLFEHLAGGAVPSVDALYDDLRRFGPDEREQLEAIVAEHGLRMLRERRPERVTVDIDTTVMPLFGH